MNKKVVFGIILVVVAVVAALSGFWLFKAATTYDATGFGRFGAPLTPLPLFHISTNVSGVDVPQDGSATIEVSIALRNLTGKPDTISLGLGSPVGEVPPFVNATFNPNTITLNAGERVNSTLTMKIDSTAPTGRYLLSAYGKSSTFGAHDKYNGAFICGSIGYSFDLNVIPASGEIPEELPEYFYENGVRIPAPTPPTATPQSTAPTPLSPTFDFPPPLFDISTNVSSVYIPQSRSAAIKVSVFSHNLTVRNDTISVNLDGAIGEIPPFVKAAIDPDTMTIKPDENINSTLTLEINSTAPIGKYRMLVRMISSTYGPYAKYNSTYVSGEVRSFFFLNVIPALGEIPEELPEYFYQNGVRIPLPTPPKG